MAKLIVTITPPTPNGDLHIGHLAGPFLGADIFTRVQRQQGHDCILVSYSDDYQSYMQRKGLETGRSPTAIATENTDRMLRTLAAANIEIDHWMRPYRNAYYLNAAREVYNALVGAGVVTRKVSPEPYCPRCRTRGYEAFGRGNCNYCGSDSDASQCEKCAFPPDAALMKDFRCKLCSGPFDWEYVERDFLQIRKHDAHLRDIYRRSPIRKPMAQWADRVLTDGPEEWPITRPHEAGLDIVGDGSCILHTWFLGLAGYMAAVREYADTAGQPRLYERFWSAPDARLFHFLGHDCAYSHMVVYPILLSHLENVTARPQFYPNQFLKLDGKNLSTSRNHAIWVREIVGEYEADAVRLYLASVAPETGEGDFQADTFRRWYQGVFIGSLGRLFRQARKERAVSSSTGATEDALFSSIQHRWRAAASLDRFSIRSLARIVLDLIAIGEQRLANGVPVRDVVEMIRQFGKAILPEVTRQDGVPERQRPAGAHAELVAK